jgi:hypothetical protein
VVLGAYTTRFVLVIAAGLKDSMHVFVAGTDCLGSCRKTECEQCTAVGCDEEGEVVLVAGQTCSRISASHNLPAGHKFGLREVVRWRVGMPQGCRPGTRPGWKKLVHHYTLEGCIVVVLEGIVRDCKVTDWPLRTQLDIGAGSQPKALYSTSFALAWMSHCSPASSSHAVILECSRSRMLNMFWRLLQGIRDGPETADHRLPPPHRHQHRSSPCAAAGALDVLDDVGSLDTGARVTALCRWEGHGSSGHSDSSTSSRPGSFFLRQQLLNMRHGQRVDKG